jgi:hypothetical protein
MNQLERNFSRASWISEEGHEQSKSVPRVSPHSHKNVSSAMVMLVAMSAPSLNRQLRESDKHSQWKRTNKVGSNHFPCGGMKYLSSSGAGEAVNWSAWHDAIMHKNRACTKPRKEVDPAEPIVVVRSVPVILA